MQVQEEGHDDLPMTNKSCLKTRNVHNVILHMVTRVLRPIDTACGFSDYELNTIPYQETSLRSLTRHTPLQMLII